MRAAVALLLLALAPAAHAQRPQAAVVPESIRVGDVFHAAVRVSLPEGMRLAVPDSVPIVQEVEQAGAREVRIDSAGAARIATVLYPLAAWRPGSYQLPDLQLRVIGAGRDSVLTVSLPAFQVSSVLPADTAGIEPKPAKDVLGANRLWWPILLALLLAAIIATLLYIWWRRRRGAEESVVFTPGVPPREAALAQLEALRREGLIERGELREFYDRLTGTLRHFAAALEPRWSVDLTTSELAGRMRSAVDITDTLELTRILGEADLVKFARAVTTRDNARRDLDAARSWVERFTAAEPETPEEQRAA
ncbi:MAG TPA: DUF4381 family protein [Longimicrobiales bacterium]